MTGDTGASPLLDDRTDVLVSGGGPVGLVLAYILAREGVTVRVLEAASHCLEDMRASTFHVPTLEMMAKLGLIDELEAQGVRAPVYQYYNRASGADYVLDLGEIADVTRYPYRLQCEQFKLARLIAARLEAMPNASVEFSRRLTHFQQDSEGVSVTGEGPIDVRHYRARYLIGADGANSLVRKLLGVGFDGFTYPESFLTLSTAYPIERHLPWAQGVNYVADPPAWSVLLRVPGLWRILVPQSGEASNAEILGDARKDAVFAQLLGPDAPSIETGHRTVYRVHQRVAKTFRVRRVLLVGDAAHLNNPLGGYGMNSGIHDAWNLADKLLKILRENADDDAQLDLFDRQRRTITHSFVQKQTIANRQGIGDGFAAREALLRRLQGDAAARRDYLRTTSMVKSIEDEALIR